jgi:type I restriction enzyme S subunit
MVHFGDVVRNVDESIRDPQNNGLERYVGLEHIDPESLHIQRWGLISEGTSFTRRFRKGQVLFGKRRAYQRKVAVAEFDGLCSSDILVFEPKDDRNYCPLFVNRMDSLNMPWILLPARSHRALSSRN